MTSIATKGIIYSITFKKMQKGMIQMRIKVKLRPMINYFHLENEPIRNVFEGTLSEELLKSVEQKYPTLGTFQEAEKKDLVSLTNAKLYEAMKEAISNYIEQLIIYASYVVGADLMPKSMVVAYGKLAADAEIFFSPITEIQEILEKLHESERKFLYAYYGLSGLAKKLSDAEIAEEFGLTVEVSRYKQNVLNHFRELAG